jgi:hypothetical protein
MLIKSGSTQTWDTSARVRFDSSGSLVLPTLLLIPIHYDEGNAARVVYHGLGARLQLDKVSAVERQRDSSNLSVSLLELQSLTKHLNLAQCLIKVIW